MFIFPTLNHLLYMRKQLHADVMVEHNAKYIQKI